MDWMLRTWVHSCWGPGHCLSQKPCLFAFIKCNHSSLLKLYSAVLSSTSLTILLYLLHGNVLRLKGLTISQFLLAAWLTL